LEFLNSIFIDLNHFLSQFNREISSVFREIKNSEDFTLILYLWGVSFFYGVIHALGPGHGKLIVSSYLLTKKNSYKKAFKIGYLISLVHTFSALLISLSIYYIIQGVVSKQFHETSEITMKISGILIILFGLYLIYENFIKKEKFEEPNLDNKKDFFIALSVGLVPCPGVMTLVIFSIIISQIYIGIISAIFMSIGMGLTISIAGILATQFHRINNQNKKINIGNLLQKISSILILILGVILIY